MVKGKPQRITGYAHVAITDREGFMSQVTIDFNERSLILSVPHALYQLPTDMPEDNSDIREWLRREPTTITCSFVGHMFIDGVLYSGEVKGIIKMFDCRAGNRVPNWLEPQMMRVLDFTDALLADDASQMPDVFDSVTASFTDMDLLIGNHPNIHSKSSCPVNSREGEEAVKIIFTKERGVEIKGMKPMTHYALIEKGVEPLKTFASLLLRANVKTESMAFWFKDGQGHPSSAVHYARPYPNNTATDYDAQSAIIRNKEGILYEAIEYAAGFFAVSRKVRVPIILLINALSIPRTNATGLRMLAATSAIQGIYKQFVNEDERHLKPALRDAITYEPATDLIKQISRVRNVYTHGNASDITAFATPRKRLALELFTQEAAIKYLFRKAELPEEIIKRWGDEEMLINALMPIGNPRRQQQ